VNQTGKNRYFLKSFDAVIDCRLPFALKWFIRCKVGARSLIVALASFCLRECCTIACIRGM
jgi:hypothetical protein